MNLTFRFFCLGLVELDIAVVLGIPPIVNDINKSPVAAVDKEDGSTVGAVAVGNTSADLSLDLSSRLPFNIKKQQSKSKKYTTQSKNIR
jgi:hypothetical protein